MRTNRIWRNNDGKVVLWQMPNVWLWIWLAAELAGFLVKRGRIHTVTHWIGWATLIIWALLEVFQGVNYFRRALGAVVLLATVASILKAGL